jgi:hypothetical protein
MEVRGNKLEEKNLQEAQRKINTLFCWPFFGRSSGYLFDKKI